MQFLRQIPARIAAIAIVSVVAVASLGYFAYGQIETALYAQKKLELTHEVELAVGIADSFAAQEKSGAIDRETAQRQAISALRDIRFGVDQNYFFIYRSNGTNVMLPPKPENEGKDLSGLHDANGVYFVRDLIAAAKSGGGVIAYEWLKPGDKDTSLKFSYAATVPEWDWMIGTGFHVQDVDSWLTTHSRTLTLAVIAAMVLIGSLAAFVGFGISRPLKRLTTSMGKLSGGDLDAEVAGIDRKDEIGTIAFAVVQFRDLLKQNMQEHADADAHRKEEAEANLVAERERIAEHFQQTMGSLAKDFVQTSKDVSEAAENLSATAEETSRQAQAVTSAAEEAAMNVENVASASEELAASVQEINIQVERSSEISVAAAEEAARTETEIRALSTAASKIGEVINLISAIAEQTNLLALNATIEAARAGDAGKGFAVVASEVKNLAGQTAQATEEISKKINEIQSATSTTVTSIGSIVSTIGTIREVTSAIASSVAQQGAATSEIAHSTQLASAGTHEVSDNIHGVGQAAEITGSAATHLNGLSGALNKHAADLQNEVAGFVKRLRA